MLRFPKGRVLYMTLESTQECQVGITMTHNKKDAPDMTVASVYSSQGDVGMSINPPVRRASQASIDSLLDTENSQSGRRQGVAMTDEEREHKAMMTLDTLSLMLGSDESNALHANKMN